MLAIIIQYMLIGMGIMVILNSAIVSIDNPPVLIKAHINVIYRKQIMERKIGIYMYLNINKL